MATHSTDPTSSNVVEGVDELDIKDEKDVSAEDTAAEDIAGARVNLNECLTSEDDPDSIDITYDVIGTGKKSTGTFRKTATIKAFKAYVVSENDNKKLTIHINDIPFITDDQLEMTLGAGIKPGDKVSFEVTVNGGNKTIQGFFSEYTNVLYEIFATKKNDN